MIPDKVRIGGTVFNVTREVDKELECAECDAEIRYSKNEIAIRSTINGDYADRVFLHEVVHGMMYAMGRKDLRTDEGFIEQLAQMLHQVLRDNNLRFGDDV